MTISFIAGAFEEEARKTARFRRKRMIVGGLHVAGERWAIQRLEMGHYSRVSQAVSRMARRPGRKPEQRKAKLLQSDP